MSKVLKIRVGRSGKKKKGKKKKAEVPIILLYIIFFFSFFLIPYYNNRVSNFFICDRNAANAMARSTNMCT